MMNLIEFFVTICYSIILMYMLLDFEVRRKRDIYAMGLFIVIFVVFDVLVWIDLGYKDFMILYPVFVHLPSFIVFRFVSRYKGIKLFFVLMTVIVLSSPPILAGHIVSYFYDYNHVILNIVRLSLYLPITFIVYKYFRPLFLYMLRNIKKGWGTFCLIPLSYNAFTYLTGRYDVEMVRDEALLWLDVLTAVLVIAAYVLILRFFKQTREQLILESEQSILTMQVSALEARSETIRKSEEKAAIYRHDLRHHLRMINGFLAENNLVEIKKYITEIEKGIDDTVTLKYCENNTVNMLLSTYINMARNENIMVYFHVYIPKGCGVSDMDLCIILSNAIENAINACMNVEDVNERKIYISCKPKNNKLLIQVTNSYTGQVEFEEDMPVSEKENHGFGTRSIASTVRKYGGLYSFTAENGVFKASIIL